MSTSRLRAESLTIAYDDHVVARDLSLDLADGRITTIIGPNGCGKSTVLRALARLLPLQAGTVWLDGQSIHDRPSREVARELALLPQAPLAPEGLLVRDLVTRGRHPHQTWFRQWSPGDEVAVDEALAWTSTYEFKDRPLESLSGGQRQRAWIAMTLAQHTDLVLLDEPTTYLDLAHQVDVLELVARLNREQGRTVVMVLHDLNLAARYSDQLVVMHAGAIVAQGAPRDVVSTDLLKEVFGLDAILVDDPTGAAPIIVPTGSKTPSPADAV
ncbi:ABC transporter ATP-binding protein [Demetria terragena]|uniref:ABC transporter ATP-binding protein n=1 Tax=Demetria terragena TaxID=63959 RepID=UPI00035FD109|nr:ABC transporter ATP-binding protein [Demetria terragena]